ncbi:glycosyl hydrolase [Paenibacillus hodogayensis]|uniref:Glycosyl hydrolase n=1 Tax=Paenibacillus hodogayensis TaxID=279208 RepID=A0ABV5VZS4_9BACL
MTEATKKSPILFSSDSTLRWERRELPNISAQGKPDLTLTGTRLQPIEGFGGCFNELGWAALSAAKDDNRREVLDQLFDPLADGLRYDIGRIPIGATDYATDWYSCNDTSGDYAMEHFTIERDKKQLLPYIQAALSKRPDMTMFASPWSPPTWMKHPQVYNYGKLTWTEQNLRAYALYLLKFVKAYATEGVTVNQLHYQNEPRVHQRFPSCIWTGEELRDFLRDYLGPVFKEESPETELWLGTLNCDNFDKYAAVVLKDPAALEYVSGVGFQWLGKLAIQRTHLTWPELRLMQTENECGDGTNSWDYAHYVFSQVWHYLNNGARSYIYWNMVLPKGGECTWGGNQNSLINIDMETGEAVFNPEFYLFKHVSRFVGQGSVRLSLGGPWSGNALAFENADGQQVIVINNPHDTDAELSIHCPDRGTWKFVASPLSFHTIVLA